MENDTVTCYRADLTGKAKVACSGCGKEEDKIIFGLFMGKDGDARLSLTLCEICRLTILKVLLRDHQRARLGKQAVGEPDAPIRKEEIDATD